MIKVALTSIMNTAKKEVTVQNELKVKRSGPYEYVDTPNEGIKKIVSKQGGYLVFLDYGRALKLNKKTGMKEITQNKTSKRVDTESEAKRLRREAEEIREGKDVTTHKKTKILFKHMIKEFQESERYRELGDSYKDHYRNYMNHFLDYFADMEPCKITSIDIENYYAYQRKRGKLPTAKKNKDGTVSKKEVSNSNPEGISINTLSKHKTALKFIWEYMIESKQYGVTQNIVLMARMPKETLVVNGVKTKVSKIVYHPTTLTLDELNYTLNDIAQNEFDRSLLVMCGLAAIGSLRHSEVVDLRLGRFYHNELMSISEDTYSYSGYDKEFYEKNDNLMMINSAIMRIGGKNVRKLPKKEKIRVSAIPDCLKDIVRYAMEQREQIYSIIDKEMGSEEQLYMPLINIIQGKELNSEKLGRKWNEYQVRRNKRMEEAGLKPIASIRYHDLRHTHANLLKRKVPEWEISCNMGHVLPDSNTTTKVYWNDSQPYREDIIEYWDSNIKIDWEKAMRVDINVPGSKVYVNGSGHLVVTTEEQERRKRENKKFIFKEEELVEMMGQQNEK